MLKSGLHKTPEEYHHDEDDDDYRDDDDFMDADWE